MSEELEFVKKYKDSVCTPARCDGKFNTKISLNTEFEKVIAVLERNEKMEKVWEIIKNKGVNIADVRESILTFGMTYTLYVRYYENYSWDLLTEEEYNFLKEEILKDEKII